MTTDDNKIIQVHFLGYSQNLFVGRLAERNRQLFFKYSPEFLNTGLEISPFKLP